MQLQVDLTSRGPAEPKLTIGQLARHVGMQTSAIRYYESIGLLSAPRRVNGRRVYDIAALQRLERVALMQKAGFTLDEMKSFETSVGDDATLSARWRQIAEAKLAEIDAQLARLQAVRTALQASLVCTSTSTRDCPLAELKPARPARRVPARG